VPRCAVAARGAKTRPAGRRRKAEARSFATERPTRVRHCGWTVRQAYDFLAAWTIVCCGAGLPRGALEELGSGAAELAGDVLDRECQGFEFRVSLGMRLRKLLQGNGEEKPAVRTPAAVVLMIVNLGLKRATDFARVHSWRIFRLL